LTHRKVWAEFAAGHDDWCLVVESNVKLTGSVGDYIKQSETLNESDPDWDAYFPYELFEIYEKRKKAGNLRNPNFWEHNKPSHYYYNFKWGNSIYMLSRKGAQKLSALAQITDRPDNTLVEMTENEQLNLYYEATGWFDYRSIVQYEWSDRRRSMLETVAATFSWDRKGKSIAKDLLKAASETALETNADLLLCGGTHLGYVRHGSIMPWDDSIDLGIEEKNAAAFLTGLEKKGYVHGEFIEPISFASCHKIWRKDGAPIDGYEYKFPVVNLWTYALDGDDLRFTSGIVWPKSAKKGLTEVVFEGSLFKIPSNSFNILDARYSDWRDNIRIYPWSHREESPLRRPMAIPVRINRKGRADFPSADYFDF
jgi:hypothetical protein